MLSKTKIHTDQVLSELFHPQFLSECVRYETISLVVDIETETKIKDSNKNLCLACQKYFISERGLRQHIGKKHNSKKRHSACALCPKKFRNKYALHFHIKQVHQQATKVACSLCQIECYNKYALKRHMNKHH